MAKKTNRKKLIWMTISVFITLLILTVVGLFYFEANPQTIVGFSTLSLSKAYLESKNSYLNGEAWILTVVQGRLAQRAYGTFSPDDVQSITSDEKNEKRL